MPAVGARVRVPVGTRMVTGCVVQAPATAEAPGEVKELLEIVDAEPLLPAAVVELCQWVADYYLAGIGDAIAVALPPGARQKASSFRTRRTAMLTAQGASVAAANATDADLRLTARQREAIVTLGDVAAPLPLSDLRDRGITADVLGRLARHGLVTLIDEAHERDPFADAAIPDVSHDAA